MSKPKNFAQKMPTRPSVPPSLPGRGKRVRSQRGQGLTEYLILLILISVVSLVAARTLGTTIKSKIQVAREHINKGITVEDAD